MDTSCSDVYSIVNGLIDLINQYIEIYQTNESKILLEEIYHQIYYLVYRLCCIKVRRIPLLDKPEKVELNNAYREERELNGCRPLLKSLARLLIMLKVLDPEAANIIASNILSK